MTDKRFQLRVDGHSVGPLQTEWHAAAQMAIDAGFGHWVDGQERVKALLDLDRVEIRTIPPTTRLEPPTEDELAASPETCALAYALWDAGNQTKLKKPDDIKRMLATAERVRRWLRLHNADIVKLDPQRKAG
jgi:hypothetical protein